MDSAVGDGGSLSPTVTACRPCRAKPGGHTGKFVLDGVNLPVVVPTTLRMAEEAGRVR